MKKISLILILLLLFSITGCSKENVENEIKNDDLIDSSVTKQDYTHDGIASMAYMYNGLLEFYN